MRRQLQHHLAMENNIIVTFEHWLLAGGVNECASHTQIQYLWLSVCAWPLCDLQYWMRNDPPINFTNNNYNAHFLIHSCIFSFLNYIWFILLWESVRDLLFNSSLLGKKNNNNNTVARMRESLLRMHYLRIKTRAYSMGVKVELNEHNHI